MTRVTIFLLACILVLFDKTVPTIEIILYDDLRKCSSPFECTNYIFLGWGINYTGSSIIDLSIFTQVIIRNPTL